MKLRSLAGVLWVMLSFSSCSEKYEFWDISHFKVVPEALADSQTVYMVYCSRGPDLPEKLDGQIGVVESVDGSFPLFKPTDYYVHYVVVHADTKDTLNILTPEGIEITQYSKTSPFMYTADTDLSKKAMYNLKSIKAEDGFKLSELEVPEFNRVARDPDFDHVADNDFPTVIGFVQEVE